MTKRLTIVMVALALFVLMAIAPVSAKYAENGTQIQAGATVFIGEENLNLTQAMNGAFLGMPTDETVIYGTPADLRIGWWASAAVVTTTAPTRIINLDGRYRAFTVAPADFVGYTGNWYLIDNASSTNAARLSSTTALPAAVFNVQDPTLDIKVWDLVNARDVSGKSVPQGMDLAFQIDTNMYAATYTNRNNTMFNWSIGLPTGPGSSAFTRMPNGAASTWNFNGTGASVATWNPTNGTYIYQVYPNQVSTNVWRWQNYTMLAQMTWADNNTAGGKYGNYFQMYWNNTAMPVATTDAMADSLLASGAYSAQNFTLSDRGLPRSLIVDNQVFGAPDNWATGFGLNAWGGYAPNPSSDGFITIKVKDESGTTFTSLLTNVAGTNSWSLLKNFVNTQPWTWASNSRTLTTDYTTGSFWETDAVDFNNQYAYPVGTYTVTAESTLNKMKDNHKNSGADYTGKTVSQSYTVTLVSDTVKIEANKDSVVRSKPFSITVTGKPSTKYYVWVKGTSSMDGTYDNQPPMVNLNQEGVGLDEYWLAGAPDTAAGVRRSYGYHPIGDYAYQNGAGKTIRNDTAPQTFNGTRYYCNITTSSSGTRTVEFVTNNWTKAQRYTIRVEALFGTEYKSDEVDVKVEKGAVTIVAAGDQSYYLGEEIKFSGTNTESYKTYLFIVGPNLKAVGSQIQSMDPRKWQVTDGAANTFQVANVNGDNTWSWKWGTSTVALDAGTYTVYAVSQPHDKDHLENAAYGTVSIIIKKPFVSATASQSTVAKGDRIYITGTAEGDPKAVQIWILGKNYAVVSQEAVNPDASFKYEVRQTTTKTLYAGQYFVVVQHPMQNDDFDIYLYSADTSSTKYGEVWNKMLNKDTSTGSTGAQIFQLLGQSSLQGSDAAEALVQGINDPNVDDTYTKLQFLVEEPVIRIDAIGDKRVGDKFTITAQTNLAVDDEILVQVYSSSFKPTQKSQSGEFSGATGTVKVTKGDSGMNKITFDVDSSTFKPDEYIVTEAAVIQEATGTALFNVLEGSAPTAAPTVVVTTAAPVTAAPTQAPTQAPTAVPTTKSPGYGALIALIGLGAVAFIVVRRH